MGLFGNWFGSRDQRSSDEPAPAQTDARATSEQPPISHALVLPDRNFLDWYYAAEPYSQHFERVAVVRSPAGNDLNRYRNVTAVEAPSVWLKDSALNHIRRVYRSVVRVDVIKASSPAQLARILQDRIDYNDRYGERFDDGHIDDRFVLGWPSDAQPARIERPFGADTGAGRLNEGVDIYTPAGTTVRTPIDGTIVLIGQDHSVLDYGSYIQIGTFHNGVHYLITLTHLNHISGKAGQIVQAGDPIALADGQNVRMVVQSPGRGLPGFILPHIIDPTDLIYWNTMRLRPVDDGLRLRRRPGTGHDIITHVNATDDLETLEMHGRTLAKVGRQNQWINVRAPNGRTGYSAAWFLEAIAPELIDRAQITGVNLDLNHRLGKPSPARLGGLDWVRLAYNVSFDPTTGTYGNTDLQKTYARYRPYLEAYARAGYRVILVLTHQTYGEGAGFNWNAMDSGLWSILAMHYVEMVREIARQYAGQNIIHAYQIWNEQDAPPNAHASVTMPPGDYAFLLGESIRAIRAVDPQVQIITGGHVGGPAAGSAYARATLRAMPPGIVPDGIAVHPYGRGASPGLPYAPFGHVDDEIESYRDLLPDKPLWITEWGVLDLPQEPADRIARYAADMVRHVRSHHPGDVAAMVWFAWAHSMHNGYGLVDINNQPCQPLYDQFLNL